MAESKKVIKARQHRINLFIKEHLKGVAPLREDGVMGDLTRRYIRHCKWWLGFKKGSYDGSWSEQLDKMLIHPYYKVLSSPATVARGLARRRIHNRAWRRHQHPTSGVTTFDGRPVAAWMVQYLQWARDHGWHGTLVSGYRDPVYSEHLCYAMCGAPSCSGRCAGRRSNHSGSVKPRGAVDVTFYDDFGDYMRRCPYEPRLFNALPSDRVHYSATGR